MKILLLNQDWFAAEWRREGHEVFTCGLNAHLDCQLTSPLLHIDTILQSQLGGFEPEVIMVHDNSSPIMVVGLEETVIPTAFYSVDTHHHYDLHSYLYEVFDFMFVAQKDHLSYFESLGQSPVWLPLWASRHCEASTDKRYGASFVGTMNPSLNPERVAFFNELRQEVDIYCTTGEFWEIFPYSDIVVNQTVKRDLNFRVFEAMMCGAMLLTEHTDNGLFELFQEGVHLRTYRRGDAQDAARRIREGLEDLEGTRRLAAAGREEILRVHTEKHRAQAVLTVLRGLKKRRSSKKFFSAMINFAVLAMRLLKFRDMACILACSTALKCAEQGGAHQEELSNTMASHIVRCAYHYDRLTGSGGGRALIETLHHQYPQDIVLLVAHLRELLNQGRRVEARELARTRADEDPEALFNKAEEFVRSIVQMEDIGG